MEDLGGSRHGGEHLRGLREKAGMTVGEVAGRAGVDPEWLADVEKHGTESLGYGEITALIRATQPPRPDWWDEGYEHDLMLGPEGYAAPRTETQRRYWRRIEAVRATIRDHYRRGRAASA